MALLRLFDIQEHLHIVTRRIVFLTAMTHAAIQAVLSKLKRLMQCYREVENLEAGWLDRVKLEHVTKGASHPAPALELQNVYVYAGTVYQVSITLPD